ncbi:MAG: nitroreductase family protein [Candidatus Omnitrophota bacterium]
MDTYKAIISRRSIRKFKQKQIPKKVIEKILESARLGPSAANLQPCEFIVVDEPERKGELFSALKWAGYIAPSGNPSKEERPLTYIVTITDSRKSKDWALIDASIAMENMILTAWNEGIASCWLGAIDKERIRQILAVPSYYNVEFVLALGYSAEKSVLEEYKRDVKYWKDDSGVMHVPKRSLKDIVHKNKF